MNVIKDLSKLKIKVILRLVVAIVFALVATIFSELVPETFPVNRLVARILIALFAGFIGFSLFPDIASRITILTLSFINLFSHRLSTEIMNRMVKLPHSSSGSVPLGHHVPIGGVSANQPIITDTSALIDGRVLDIAKTGFISGVILIPDFVLTELQQVADSSDYLKRSRARRGFEIIEDLKKVKGLRVEIWEKDLAGKNVDEKILKLTKNLGGKLLTTDFNLNRVASVSGIKVLNINDLANAVKTVAIPGEIIKIKVIHLGKDSDQGVGYLDDGTMVVVEKASDLVGKDIKVEVTRMIQVAAGRMIFTKKSS